MCLVDAGVITLPPVVEKPTAGRPGTQADEVEKETLQICTVTKEGQVSMAEVGGITGFLSRQDVQSCLRHPPAMKKGYA